MGSRKARARAHEDAYMTKEGRKPKRKPKPSLKSGKRGKRTGGRKTK